MKRNEIIISYYKWLDNIEIKYSQFQIIIFQNNATILTIIDDKVSNYIKKYMKVYLATKKIYKIQTTKTIKCFDYKYSKYLLFDNDNFTRYQTEKYISYNLNKTSITISFINMSSWHYAFYFDFIPKLKA